MAAIERNSEAVGPEALAIGCSQWKLTAAIRANPDHERARFRLDLWLLPWQTCAQSCWHDTACLFAL